MSWSELQRLVEEAEADRVIRRGLRHCRSGQELLLACRRLGYAIEAADLRQARALERASRVAAAAAAAPVPRPFGAALPPTVKLPIAS